MEGVFPGRKQVWPDDGAAPEPDEVLDWSWGNRSQHTVRKLYRQLQSLDIDWLCTDNWPAFTKLLPQEKHLIGKAYTRSIEGVNLSLRTRNRRFVKKPVCFFKKEQIHYTV